MLVLKTSQPTAGGKALRAKPGMERTGIAAVTPWFLRGSTRKEAKVRHKQYMCEGGGNHKRGHGAIGNGRSSGR